MKSKSRLASCLAPILAALFLLPAPVAHAQGCQAPPGLSALEQYCETIPGPRGATGPSDAGSGSTRLLPPSVRRALARGGANERELLTFLDKYGPLSSDRRVEGRPPGFESHSSGVATGRTAAEGGALSAIKSSLETGARTNRLLPWVLLGLTLFALVASVLRSRMRRLGSLE